jgi:hypothetical protein
VLDDELGTITFGDGRHGMIPPVGRDSILAESYRRGGGEAANRIRAFGEANLVTPVAGVDRIVLVGDAAGGADPESPERTLRFAPAKVFQRDRLLTLADLETAALEHSPDVAQAVAVPRANRIDVFLAMRGAETLPTAAQRRAAEDYLRQRVVPDLAGAGRIVAQSVQLVHARVDVNVVVDDLRNAGRVSDGCVERIKTLLDPAAGGWDGVGWPLGAVPTEADIAGRLDGLEHVEELGDIQIVRVEDGTESALPAALRAQQLVALLPDGVRVRVAASEKAA